MSALSVDFCGIELKNPIVIASSPATESLRGIMKCAEAGAGAVVTKSIADYDNSALDIGARRTRLGPNGFWATSTFRRETLNRQQGENLVKAASSSVNIPIIASATGTTLSSDSWIDLCTSLRDAGAKIIQLDLFYLPQPVCEHDTFSELIKLFDSIVDAVRIPIMPKLNIEIPAYFAAAYLKKCRVSAISLIDSVRVPSPFDIHMGGRTTYEHVGEVGMSSLFGTWQLPITQHYTMILGRLCNLPICAGGGLTDGYQAVEMLMLGATVVQYASAILINGYNYINSLIREIEGFIDEHNYRSIKEIHSIVVKKMSTDIEDSHSVFASVKAHLDPMKCSKCKRCSELAFCDAIHNTEDHPYIEHGLCDGCGFCRHHCPSEAISLK